MALDPPVRVARAMDSEDFPDGVRPAFLPATLLASARIHPRRSFPARPSHSGGGAGASGVPPCQWLGLDLALVPTAPETAHGLCHRRAHRGHSVGERAEVPAFDR